MLQKFPNIKRVIINDINHNLTESYRVIKQEPEGLVYRLKHIEQQYLPIEDYEEQRAFYLEMRRCFNEEALSSLDKTALLIFLNRTCFSGLYRENRNRNRKYRPTKHNFQKDFGGVKYYS